VIKRSVLDFPEVLRKIKSSEVSKIVGWWRFTECN